MALHNEGTFCPFYTSEDPKQTQLTSLANYKTHNESIGM